MMISSVKAQTYLGKRFFLNVGSSFSPSFSFAANGRDSIHIDYESSVFPPEVELEIGAAVSSRLSISATAAYRGLKNSEINMETSSGNPYSVYIMYADTFRIRTNSFNYGMNLKWHKDYAPMGTYFLLGLNYTQTNATIYPTLVKDESHTVNAQNTYQLTETYRLDPIKTKENFMGLSLGMGKSELLTRSLYIDYGAKFNIYFGSLKLDYDYIPKAEINNDDFMDQLAPLVRGTIFRNLQTTNLIEIYVKFGLVL